MKKASVPKLSTDAKRGQSEQRPPTPATLIPQRKQLAGMS